MIGDGDVEAILANGDFDVAAVFTISTGPTVTSTINGWFTEGTHQQNPLTFEIETVLPMFDCPTSTLVSPLVKSRMAVTIGGHTYSVERLQDNGNGVTTVHLNRTDLG